VFAPNRINSKGLSRSLAVFLILLDRLSCLLVVCGDSHEVQQCPPRAFKKNFENSGCVFGTMFSVSGTDF
jgi:hypothetical protein